MQKREEREKKREPALTKSWQAPVVPATGETFNFTVSSNPTRGENRKNSGWGGKEGDGVGGGGGGGGGRVANAGQRWWMSVTTNESLN